MFKKYPRCEHILLVGGQGTYKDITAEVNYIPIHKVECIENNETFPLITLLIGKKDNIIVTHMGFIIKEGENIFFRHASSEEKKVVDKPLCQYLNEKKEVFLGFMLVRVKE